VTDHDLHAVLVAMTRYGGGFAKALAEATVRADAENRAILLGAFGPLFEQYRRQFVAPREVPS
jgi:hypothetical protein